MSEWNPNMHEAPANTRLLLGWHEYGQWQYEVSEAMTVADNRIIWRHGLATHWRQLPEEPEREDDAAGHP